MSDITKFSAGTALTLDSLLDGLDNSLQNAPRVQNKQGMKYLKMAGPKHWVAGKEAEPVEATERLVVHPFLFTQGYVAWHGGRPEFQQMIPAKADLSTIALPDANTLKAKNGLEFARGMVVVGLDDWYGVQMEYTINSRGGREAIEALMDDVAAESRAQGEPMCPVITLDTDTYNHSEHGPITKPIFHTVDWMTMDDMMAMAEGEGEEPDEIPLEEPAPKPAARRRRKAG